MPTSGSAAVSPGRTRDRTRISARRWLFSAEDIHRLRPLKSNAAITAEAAGEFAKVAKAMRGRGLDSQQVAHFLIQCIFCMYAEDEGLLHEGISDDPQIFTAILKSARDDAERAGKRISNLFIAMQNGGSYGNDDIAWFNGGLFKVIAMCPRWRPMNWPHCAMRRKRSTGAPSTQPSSAPCSSVAWTRTPARRSARTTPMSKPSPS
ncbi:MAG TPA: type IIL restriction-modification enzyme MmeI [Pseudomonas sp.]|nr:type IIL restriction-modification enzyme MmeI [Pseudomonas sp.]